MLSFDITHGNVKMYSKTLLTDSQAQFLRCVHQQGIQYTCRMLKTTDKESGL